MSVEETKTQWANIVKILALLVSPRSHLNSSNSASLCAAIKKIRTALSWRWRDGSRMRSSLILTTYNGFWPRLEAGQLNWNIQLSHTCLVDRFWRTTTRRETEVGLWCLVLGQ